MSTFKEIQELGIDCKCDHCHEVINYKDITLKPCSDNIRIVTPVQAFVFVDKDNKVISSGASQPSGENGDRFLCCPLCGKENIWGFDSA